MCEICDISERNPGLKDETIMEIIRVVEQREKEHLDHTVMSILATLGVEEVTITAEVAQDAAEKLDYEGYVVSENVSADWSSMTMRVEKGEANKEDAPQPSGPVPLSPLKPGEVSDANDVAALFKALGLEF